MNTVSVWICLMFVLIQNSHAMRCRSGNEQMIDDVEEVMSRCRRKNSESGKNDSNSSKMNESSEEDSSSNSGLFDQDFFSNAKKDIQNIKKNYGNESVLSGNNSELYRQQSLYMNPSNYTNIRENQYRESNGNNDNGSMINGMPHDNQGSTDGDSSGKSCVVQCFFEELNSVNQHGFPERTPVTKILLRGIQNPNLRDFIEQSILECFQFLSSEMNIDKCTFSQNLLSCFADKGREQCDDWYD